MPPENAMEYKSVNNGGKCPVAPDVLTYNMKVAKNVIPSIPFFGMNFNTPYFS